MLLQNAWVNNKIKEDLKIYLETNENVMTRNLWDTARAILRGKFLATQAYLGKQEKSQINDLTLHLKKLGKEVQRTK